MAKIQEEQAHQLPHLQRMEMEHQQMEELQQHQLPMVAVVKRERLHQMPARTDKPLQRLSMGRRLGPTSKTKIEIVTSQQLKQLGQHLRTLTRMQTARSVTM